jgi:hypothetical protein
MPLQLFDAEISVFGDGVMLGETDETLARAILHGFEIGVGDVMDYLAIPFNRDLIAAARDFVFVPVAGFHEVGVGRTDVI